MHKTTNRFVSAAADSGNASLVLPSDWNQELLDAEEMTNLSGVTLAAGDMVVLSNANTEAVILGDTVNSKQTFLATLGARSGRTLASVTNTSVGFFASHGVRDCLITGTATLGNYVAKSATTKALYDTGTAASAANTPPSGAVGICVEGTAGGVAAVYLFGGGGSGGGELPRSYLAGLQLAQAADTDHDITTSVGEARSDADTTDMVLASALTKQIDAAWTVGNNLGGLDTGVVAGNSWYHVHLIKRTDTGVVDALFSLSLSSPTMPAGYTERRRIGSVLTDGAANIRAFTQFGSGFLWTTPILDVAGSLIEAATLHTLSVPLGLAVTAHIQVSVNWTTGAELYLSTPAQADQAPSLTLSPLSTHNDDGATRVSLRVDTSSRIRSRTTGTLDTPTGLSIVTVGWDDRRGKDN